MRDSEERREEKLEGREVHLRNAGGFSVRTERPHGKLYRWFDNFWYHHKWKTIIIAFFAVVILVCALQMCSRAPSADVSVLIVGPKSFIAEDSGYSQLEGLLSSCVPEDYNEDGTENAEIVNFTVFSEEQIKELAAHVDEKGEPDPIVVNTSTNSENYQQFFSYLSTGETAILMLDRWIYETPQVQNLLIDLSTQLDFVPNGALYATGQDGHEHLLGVRLGDTLLYQNNSALRTLDGDTVQWSEDAVLCMVSKLVTTDQEAYANAVACFVQLVK